MQKIVIHKPGGYDRLCVETHPDPHPNKGEVLVQTEAAGVNYADIVIRMGLYASAKKYVGWPITPGFEFAGRVAEVGEGVDGLAPGDAVMGVTRFGGYASHVVVPPSQLFKLPEGFSSVQAAGFPAVYLTAYYMMFDLVRPREGDRLLIHSAAGGVGGALLQLAKIAGCKATAVVGSSHKAETARQLGASDVIDKSRTDLWSAAKQIAPDGYYAVFDGNGASTLDMSYRHTATGGRLVTYGFHSMFPRRGGRPRWWRLGRDYFRIPRFNPLKLVNHNKSVMACNLSFLFHLTDRFREAMDNMSGWVNEGKLQPPPTTSYNFQDVAKAHGDLESAQTVGKLILVF